jgi:hypothetical protein
MRKLHSFSPQADDSRGSAGTALELMRRRLVILLISMTLSSLHTGCASHRPTPSNFKILLSNGTLPSTTTSGLIITASGNAIYSTGSSFPGDSTNARTIRFNVSKRDVARIWNAVQGNHFSTLAPSYDNDSTYDGNWAELAVVANRDTHAVYVRNGRPRRFSNIVRVVRSVMPDSLR